MRNHSTTRTAKSARTRQSLTLLGVLILLATASWAVSAVAGPKVATPTITSGPSGATSSTSATFAFVAGAKGDALECSLDGAAYATCTSPKTYNGLRDGAHTFRVRERDRSGQVGESASRSWTVDTLAPPAPQLVQKPADPSASDSATFAFTDGEAGVTYLCQLDGSAYAACATPITYKKLADGTHSFGVKALDAAGNVGAATVYRWRIDTVAPPKPMLTQTPPSPSASASATFAFADGEAGVSFECALDDAAYATCTSPKSYGGMSDGSHAFAVRARDAAGNRSAATTYAWTVQTATTGLPFTIAGASGGLLSPGRTADLALRVSNPNGQPILVTSLTATIQAGSSNAGCDGLRNLTVTQSNVSDANPLTVPANGSVTLPSGGVSAPSVTMLNLATNQDACKGAVFAFAFSGSSHS